MKYRRRIGSAAALAAAALAAGTVHAGPTSAATRHGAGFGGASHVVFVQTDNTAGNQVAAYHRASDGTFQPGARYLRDDPAPRARPAPHGPRPAGA